MAQYLDFSGLQTLWGKIKGLVVGSSTTIQGTTTSKLTVNGSDEVVLETSANGKTLTVHGTQATLDQVKMAKVSDSYEYPILLKPSANGTNETGSVLFPYKGTAPNVTINPNTGVLTATKFKGALQGKADSATIADRAEGDEDGLSIKGNYALANNVPPKNHASTTTTYGVGTSSNYGHVKLSDAVNDSTSGAANGIAATPKAVKAAYDNGGVQTVCGYTGEVELNTSDLNNDAGFVTTDNKVLQTQASQNYDYPVLFKFDNATGTGADVTNSVKYGTALKINPNTGNLTVTKVNSYTLAAACAKGVLTSLTAGTTSTNLPTGKAVVDFVASQMTGAATFQGVINTNSSLTILTTYKKGWYWTVGTAGTYAGVSCEVGDQIYCISNFNSSFSNNDFTVVQGNITPISEAQINEITV